MASALRPSLMQNRPGGRVKGGGGTEAVEREGWGNFPRAPAHSPPRSSLLGAREAGPAPVRSPSAGPSGLPVGGAQLPPAVGRGCTLLRCAAPHGQAHALWWFAVVAHGPPRKAVCTTTPLPSPATGAQDRQHRGIGGAHGVDGLRSVPWGCLRVHHAPSAPYSPSTALLR